MKSWTTFLFSVELCCFPVQCLEEWTLAVILVSDLLRVSLEKIPGGRNRTKHRLMSSFACRIPRPLCCLLWGLFNLGRDSRFNRPATGHRFHPNTRVVFSGHSLMTDQTATAAARSQQKDSARCSGTSLLGSECSYCFRGRVEASCFSQWFWPQTVWVLIVCLLELTPVDA